MSIFSKLFGKKKPQEIIISADKLSNEIVTPDAVEPEQPPVVKPDSANAAAPELFKHTYNVYAACVIPEDIATDIRPSLLEHFRTLSESSDGFTGTLLDGAEISIEIDSDEPETFVDMLTRRFATVGAANISQVLFQIAMFNVRLCFHCEAKTFEKLHKADSMVFAVAKALNGFVERDEKSLYRFDRLLLINLSGETELKDFAPETVVPESESEDALRIKASMTAIAEHGIDKLCDSPVQVNIENAHVRPAEEITQRIAALYACVATASAYLSPKEIAVPASFVSAMLDKLDRQYNIARLFTPKEIQYIRQPKFHSTMLSKAECIQVLLWAVGLMDLDWANKPADIAQIGALLKNMDMGTLNRKAHLRPVNELMDAQDLTYRLHSISVRNEIPAELLDEDIVYERHYALNWLLGVDGAADWDNVTAKT